MEHFDPDIKYTAAELAGFIVSGTISGVDGLDYARPMRDDIARHVERLQDELRAALVAHMKRHPECYGPVELNCIVNGADVRTRESMRAVPEQKRDLVSRFVLSRQTIKASDMARLLSITREKVKVALSMPTVCQVYDIKYLDGFPDGRRTDVIMLGMPRSGKTTLISNILLEMRYRRMATVVRHTAHGHRATAATDLWLADMCGSAASGKFPAHTPAALYNFASIDLHTDRGDVPVNIYDSGLWDGTSSADILRYTEVHDLLMNPNPKILLFVIDYSLCSEQADTAVSIPQGLFLSDLVTLLGHNGGGKDGEKGCTLSRTDAIGVVVTKTDMLTSRKEKYELPAVVRDLVGRKYATFVNNLQSACSRFGLPAPVYMARGVKQGVGGTYSPDWLQVGDITDFIRDMARPRTLGTRLADFLSSKRKSN